MFTGIVEEMGTVKAIKKGAALPKGARSAVLEIGAMKILEDINIGDSIAVNGVCLTVTSYTKANNSFLADVMHETVRRTGLQQLQHGSRVNLERAMPANGRFGGHIVSGHVDGMGVIQAITKDDNAKWFTIKAAPQILRYIIEKGSITIDGISLTVAAVTAENFSVSVIPHTVAQTTLGEKRVGDNVNIENDCLGKYVEKLLNQSAQPATMTREFLIQNGF